MKDFKDALAVAFKRHGGALSNKKCMKLSRIHEDEVEPQPHNCYMVKVNGELICPMCKKEQDAINFTKELRESEAKRQQDKIDKFILDNSVMPKNLKNKLFEMSFDNYNPNTPEQSENLQKAQKLADEYIQGDGNGALLQGKPGRGKTHLAMSILRAFNGKGLFISLGEMITLLKAGIHADRNYPYTEEYFLNLADKADLVVLDDLGTNSGINRQTGLASGFVMDKLNNLLDHCERIITTTNLSPAEIQSIYNERLGSRFFEGTMVNENHFLKFNSGKDHRLGGI